MQLHLTNNDQNYYVLSVWYAKYFNLYIRAETKYRKFIKIRIRKIVVLDKIRNEIFRAVLVDYVLQYKPGVECMLGCQVFAKRDWTTKVIAVLGTLLHQQCGSLPKQDDEFVEKRETHYASDHKLEGQVLTIWLSFDNV